MCPYARRSRPGGPTGSSTATAPRSGPTTANLPRAETDPLITDFNRRVLTQQPLRVAAAYGRDVAKVFALTRTTSRATRRSPAGSSRPAYPYFPPHATGRSSPRRPRRFGGGAPAVWRPVAAFLRSYQLGGGYTPGPVLALCTLAGLAGSAALLRRRAGPRIRQPALACLLFFTLGGGAAAGVRPVRVLLAVPAARARHAGARPARSGSPSSSAGPEPGAVLAAFPAAVSPGWPSARLVRPPRKPRASPVRRPDHG